jgi:hypothetical protein
LATRFTGPKDVEIGGRTFELGFKELFRPVEKANLANISGKRLNRLTEFQNSINEAMISLEDSDFPM